MDGILAVAHTGYMEFLFIQIIVNSGDLILVLKHNGEWLLYAVTELDPPETNEP